MNVGRQENEASAAAGSRARLVRAAADLLRRQGYAVTGVKEIARAASAPMGSFYFHFPGGKEALAAEAMQHGSDEFREVLVEALSGGRDLTDSYARIPALIAWRLTTRGWAMGCPVATTALETLDTSPVLQAAAQSAFEDWQRVLAQHAVRAGVPEPDAHELASTALSLIEGAELVARVARSTQPLAHAATALRTLVHHAIASAPSPSNFLTDRE